MYELKPQFIVYASSAWYSVPRLLTELKHIRSINFTVVEQRQQALERLSKIVQDAPFAVDKRFPQSELYICELLGDWPRKFQQLKAALSYKDVDSQKNSSETSGKNDAIISFWNATTAMLDQIVKMDNIWTRESFEATFGLNWQAA